MTSDGEIEGTSTADARVEPDLESRPAATIRQSPRLGRRLDTWGWVALAVGVVALSGDESSAAVWTPVGFLAMVVGLWAVLRGRRHLSWVLPGLGAVSEREGVVLFLRSFSEEEGYARKVSSRPLRWLIVPPPVTPSEVRTEEEQIARGVAPFGGMVALGPTSDRLPRAGAVRSYAADDRWQAEDLTALDKANLVLLSTGPGEQLRWEVEQVVRRDDPARLVLLVPRTPGMYEDFWRRLGHLFPMGLPELSKGRVSRVRYVRAVVWFDADWTPHLEPLRGRLPLLRFAARTQRALPRALRHVFERAGVQPPVTGKTALPRPKAATASVALLFLPWLVMASLSLGLLKLLSHLVGEDGGLGIGPVTGSLLFAALLILAPFAWWMQRVSRGGPLAVLYVQILSLAPGIGWVILGIQSIQNPDVGLALWVGEIFLGLFLMLPAVLLLRRDARDWVDSWA